MCQVGGPVPLAGGDRLAGGRGSRRLGVGSALRSPVERLQHFGGRSDGAFTVVFHVSILAAATLQPALLSIYGRGGTHRVAVAAFLRSRLHVPVRGSAESDDVEHRFWARLAGSIMRRKWLYALAVGALLAVGTIPVACLQLTPGATAGIPQSPPSVRGLRVLEDAVGPGAIAPAQVLVDSGRCIVGLQEFGCGLAVAILLDATLVRAVLVPALMAIMGRYNWWLPAPLARLVRVRSSPLRVG